MEEKESELDEKAYPQILNECSKAVEQIRAHLSHALEWYHYLGRVLIQHNVEGEGIKRLSRDLGPGFSQTTLYRCIEFAHTYSDPKAFYREHGEQSWRSVTRILVKHSRSVNLHGCKTKAGAFEPFLPIWETEPVIACPYCDESMSLSMYYASIEDYRDRRITIEPNKTHGHYSKGEVTINF